MIEAQVHSSLRDFLREQGKPSWPHHLTMARLVARALRLGRPALIQTGSAMTQYCLSYLTPALLWGGSVILVTPGSFEQRLLKGEISQLQQYVDTDKEIRIGDRWPDEDRFQGLLLTSTATWLADRLEGQGRFPKNIPTLIDRADDLEEWTREQLRASLCTEDWNELMRRSTHQADLIRDVRVQLTKAIFGHPKNPYRSCLIEASEQESLQHLFESLEEDTALPASVHKFWHRWQTDGQLMWASIAREQGSFKLHVAPVEIATALSQVWSQQPVVLMGGFLDWETSAPVYRQQLGLGDLTCLKFSPDRQNEHIQLYLPDRLPMPNTPQFQAALMQQVRTLVSLSSDVTRPVVLLIEDVPLKAQVGATLAAEFGSRVRVEKVEAHAQESNSILVSGWEFWRSHQEILPTPQLLVISTLPIPSLENPLVAGRVAYYKRQRKDWFRLYLLPAALRELQRAVVPLRESQGIVALLDNRVNHRSYGSKILTALEPYARINYLDASWFSLDRS